MALLFSRNCKTNLVCTRVMQQLNDLGKEEVKRYIDAFPHEVDYNIVQYGNLLCYYDDVRKMYEECGYKTEYYSNTFLWEAYKRVVRFVIRTLNDRIGYYK